MIGIAFPAPAQEFSSMRKILFSAGFLLVSMLSGMCGQLDIAVIRFPSAIDPAELNDALSRVKLAEIADADRTRTSERLLKGGTVLFAQSLGVNPGSRFGSSTRIGNNRADVEGSLGSGKINATISLFEGVKAGLRNFEKKTYGGSGDLPAGPARVISIRQASGVSPTVIKGKSKLDSYSFSIALIAQYTP